MSMAHALFDQLTTWLIEQGGAQCIIPTESHPFALANFAAAQGGCAITIDWFTQGYKIPDGYVIRPISESHVHTEMSLVRLASRQRKRGLDVFWGSAERVVAQMRGM
ncbi:hypothetical protein PSEUDO9AZ_70001 [Pseudomonas sp. 9AZ]|nr:hypothetical protein PSEUDO9AZ_70001 [Pseudomonas sp. 9AZ]